MLITAEDAESAGNTRVKPPKLGVLCGKFEVLTLSL